MYLAHSHTAVILGPCTLDKNVDSTLYISTALEEKQASDDVVSNNDVVAQAGMPSMFAMLSQRPLRSWIGHVSRMNEEHSSMRTCHWFQTSRKTTSPRQERDMKACDPKRLSWEAVAINRSNSRPAVKSGIQISEKKKEERWEEGRNHRCKDSLY